MPVFLRRLLLLLVLLALPSVARAHGVLLALVAAAGAWNWRRVRPALVDAPGMRRLRRGATVELALGAAVLVVTAVLVATPTDVVP